MAKENFRRSLLFILVCVIILVVLLERTRPWDTIADATNNRNDKNQHNNLRPSNIYPKDPDDESYEFNNDNSSIVNLEPLIAFLKEKTEENSRQAIKDFIVQRIPDMPIDLVDPDVLDELKTLDLSNLVTDDADSVIIIPSDIGVLTNLQELDLSFSSFRGTLPSELGLLTQLQRLDVSNNQITGMLPLEIGQLTNLQYLNVSFNELWGILPDGPYENLRHIKQLDVSNNNLSGRYPRRWKHWEQLQVILLQNNQFTQRQFPSEPYGTQIQYIAIDGTPQGDDIPDSYCTELAFLQGVRVDCPLHKGNNGINFFSLMGYICDCCVCSNKWNSP